MLSELLPCLVLAPSGVGAPGQPFLGAITAAARQSWLGAGLRSFLPTAHLFDGDEPAGAHEHALGIAVLHTGVQSSPLAGFKDFISLASEITRDSFLISVLCKQHTYLVLRLKY